MLGAALSSAAIYFAYVRPRRGHIGGGGGWRAAIGEMREALADGRLLTAETLPLTAEGEEEEHDAVGSAEMKALRWGGGVRTAASAAVGETDEPVDASMLDGPAPDAYSLPALHVPSVTSLLAKWEARM